MFEVLPTNALQDASGSLGTLLATWLIWPILCGYIGFRKGNLRRGILNGLFWGPIGLALVLLLERKYACPTCGQQTLKQPHADEARLAPVLSVPASKLEALPRSRVATNRREPTPAMPMSKEEREKIVMAACAGYDAEEEARLRSWLNSE